MTVTLLFACCIRTVNNFEFFIALLVATFFLQLFLADR